MERILVGLDGSPQQPGVLRVARTLAERLSARLILFRAVGLPAELPPEALGLTPDGVTAQLESLARADLERVAAELPASLRTEVSVAVGVPWRAVCDAAKACRADLVVIGSHGYGGIDRLIGTTAAKVVNHCERPVLVSR